MPDIYSSSEASKKLLIPPIHMYRGVFCNSCSDEKYCRMNRQQMHACILIKIADELAKMRQLKQGELVK